MVMRFLFNEIFSFAACLCEYEHRGGGRAMNDKQTNITMKLRGIVLTTVFIRLRRVFQFVRNVLKEQRRYWKLR